MSDIVPLEPSDIQYMAEAVRWLMQTSSIADVQAFRDRMEEAAHLMKRRGYALSAFNQAAELKLRSERRLGELLAETVRHQGGRPPKNGNTVLPFLPDDVTKIQSSRWQRVFSVPQDLFEEFLHKTREKGEEITTAALLRLLKTISQPGKQDPPSETASVEDLQQLIDTGKRFGTIYADPPWQYGNQGTRAATDNHYQTMTVAEIAALPINDLAAEESHLHLWTTNGFLPDAFDIIKAWGFAYKSCFVWCKPQLGIGNYWRVSHEFLLLGVRGGCEFRDHSQISWAQEERTTHSSKPEKFRRILEKVSPGPRLELFGRKIIDGWVVWGNQIERTMFDKAASEPWVESEDEESALSLFNNEEAV